MENNIITVRRLHWRLEMLQILDRTPGGALMSKMAYDVMIRNGFQPTPVEFRAEALWLEQRSYIEITESPEFDTRILMISEGGRQVAKGRVVDPDIQPADLKL